MHGYAEAKGALPPPALIGDDGKPLLSWRVLLLPYLEHRELFEQFRLDEPWDSPHNRALLPKMPNVFAPYGGQPTAQAHTTHYQVFVGEQTPFAIGRTVRLKGEDFSDGTSNTL